MQQTRTATGTLTGLNKSPNKSPMDGPLFVYRIRDGVTVGSSCIRLQVVGVLYKEQQPRLLKDWEVVLALNRVLDQVAVKEEELAPMPHGQRRTIPNSASKRQEATEFVQQQMGALELPFQVPLAELLGTLGLRTQT
jgi:hypothetical protein